MCSAAMAVLLRRRQGPPVWRCHVAVRFERAASLPATCNVRVFNCDWRFRIGACRTHATHVLLEPAGDPFAAQANGTAPAEAYMRQLTLLASGVDRVAAHTRVLRSLRNGQPGLHGPSARPQIQRAV